jgi:hypothetical protein
VCPYEHLPFDTKRTLGYDRTSPNVEAAVGIGAESPKDVEKIAGKLSQEGEGQSVVNCEPELMTIWSP